MRMHRIIRRRHAATGAGRKDDNSAKDKAPAGKRKTSKKTTRKRSAKKGGRGRA